MSDNNKMLEPSQLAAFCRDVSMLIDANIPLHIGLATVLETVRAGSPLHSAISKIVEVMRDGGRLSEAVTSSGRFPSHLCDLVATGEQTGSLDEMIRRLAAYYERLAQFKKRVVNAVVYPVMLLCMMTVVIVVLISSVLPIFADVLSRFDSSASANTSSVMNMSVAGCTVILVLLIFALLLIAVCFILSRSAKGSAALQRLLSRIPFAKRVMYNIAVGKFTSGLAALLGSGFNLEESIETLLPSTDNDTLKSKLDNALTMMRNGETQELALVNSEIYSEDDNHTLRIAGHTGVLDSATETLATRCDERVAEQLERMSELVEPILVALLTVIVGTVMLAVMIPLIRIMSAIG
ncbi:MAG: type II secretion system F family protein [Oscillospiraceae bacterium]